MATVCLEDEVADLKCELTRLRAALVNKEEENRVLRRLRPKRRKRGRERLRLDSGRIWGYARASTEKQDTSCQMQADMIRVKAAKLSGQLVRIYEDEAISGRSISWEDRNGFRALMEVIGPGDHLVVWRFDRIDRHPFAMLDAARWLVDQNINIHVLDEGGMQLDLDRSSGRAMVMFWAMFADFFIEQLSRATAEGLAWRKERGLAYSKLPLGIRRQVVTIPDPRRPGRMKEEKVDVWDPQDCTVIREIWRRRELQGENYCAIAGDLMRRGLLRSNGRPWGYREANPRPGKKNYRPVEPMAIKRAYWSRTLLLAQGKDVEDVEPPADEVAIARERLELFAATRFRADCVTPPHVAVREYREWQKRQENGNGQGCS